VWPVRAPAAMHECGFPMPGHPSARTGAATRTGVSQHARVCQGTAAKEEGGSVVRRTQESDRAASSALAEIEVRARAVPPGSCGAEHQAIGAFPQSTDNTTGSHHLEKRREQTSSTSPARTKAIQARRFSTATPVAVKKLVPAKFAKIKPRQERYKRSSRVR